MAKTIRPLLCPQCGSPAKTTLGPELFRCNACQTEYYLDTDNVTVTIRHQYPGPPAPPPPRVPARRYGVAGIFLVIAVGALAWLAVRHFQPGAFNHVSATATKPVSYHGSYVYADAQRQPVYVTLRTEGPRWGSDSVTLYADFYDPRTGRLRHAQELMPPHNVKTTGGHGGAWHTFPNGQTYLLDLQKLYRLDAHADHFEEVTQTLLARVPAASSGIAQLEFDERYEALQVLTNDGQTLYYLPASGQALADGLALYHAAYANLPRRFCTFEWPEGAGGRAADPVLLANRPTGQYPTVAFDNLTPNRRYFQPQLLYQDSQALLIAVAPTAKPDGPHLVQCLDAATGRLVWSRPASPYGFQGAVRTADGFALSYRNGSALDYTHGVLLVGEDGRDLRDFQRPRTE